MYEYEESMGISMPYLNSIIVLRLLDPKVLGYLHLSHGYNAHQIHTWILGNQCGVPQTRLDAHLRLRLRWHPIEFALNLNANRSRLIAIEFDNLLLLLRLRWLRVRFEDVGETSHTQHVIDGAAWQAIRTPILAMIQIQLCAL